MIIYQLIINYQLISINYQLIINKNKNIIKNYIVIYTREHI